jgi:hypothetical protein
LDSTFTPRSSALSWVNEDGKIQGTSSFGTSEKNLIEEVEEIEAQTKKITLEESPLAS